MATAVASNNAAPPAGAVSKPSAARARRDKDDTNNPDINLPGIGNYAFVKTLGEGNFAKVKLAKHKITGTECAIKIIDKTQLDEKKLSKLYREVRIMKMLHHPHIVKLYEVIETKHTVFLVMECASGGELYDYLVVHGRMKEKEARAKFRQILSAVAYCHKMRVIHRDLKAENLLLDENMNIKIADFGFSNMYDPEGKLDTFCGSPPYAAPELFQGKRYTGPEVDIWSLGVILYVLTTGCLPFDGKNLQEMRESVCRGKYRIPFYLSDTCEKLLRKFLIRDPYKRASLEMLIDDPWINETYTDSPITSDLSEKVEEDENIIRLIEQKYRIPYDQIQASLRSNVYDDTAAIYYLYFYQRDKHSIPSIGLTAPDFSSPLSQSINGPISSLGPFATATQPVSLTQSFNAGAIKMAGNGMRTIEEDAPLPAASFNAGDDATARQRAAAATPSGATTAVTTASRRRRFTVGGEADAPKFNPSPEENDASSATNALKKLQNDIREQQLKRSPSDASRPSAGASLVVPGQQAMPSADTNSAASNNDPPIPIMRRRTSTIAGILGKVTGTAAPSSGRRMSTDASAIAFPTSQASTAVQSSTSDASAKEENAGNKPRSLRFTFNSNTTSTKPPDEIVSEVLKSCNKLSIVHRLSNRYLIECQCAAAADIAEPVKFEIEICKLPRLKNLHGLKFKRLSGTTGDYKDVCERLMQNLQI